MSICLELIQSRIERHYGGKVIEAKNVSKWYGAFQVLTDINLTVGKGERIVVCGLSGSGKSTLIRCFNRMKVHQEGEISVNGITLHGKMRNVGEVRKGVDMVFQHFNLFPHMTVLMNCMVGPMWIKGLPEAEAKKTALNFLERVRIPEQANKYPIQLSGGQQQRVAIASSLCMQPAVMLFDGCGHAHRLFRQRPDALTAAAPQA